MDDRQSQIRERAGLEESRLNQDFIDLMRRFGSPALVVIAAAALAWALWGKYTQAQNAKLGEAFEQFEAVRSAANANPDAFIAVADAYEGVGAVPILARLEAGKAWLSYVARGVKPGAQINEDGSLASAEDELTPEVRGQLLDSAHGAYEWVVNQTLGSPERAQQTMEGLYGLAAVAESRGEWDAARGYYERVAEIAKQRGFSSHTKLVDARLKDLGSLAALDPVPSKAEVPKPLDTAPKPEPLPAPDVPPGEGATGQPAAVDPQPPAAEAPQSAPTEPAPQPKP